MPGTSKDTSSTKSHLSQTPSPRMLQAALSGLMAASVFGCSDDKDKQQTASAKQDLSDDELRAVCAGMVADAKKSAQDDSTAKAPDLDSACEDRVKQASAKCEAPDVDKLCKDKVSDALKMQPAPDTNKVCADVVKQAEAKASMPKTADEKTISADQKEYTFADLTKMCDDRGGYAQIHAACGGHNTCAGFSYGDWGPGAAMLTEHSCSDANGCNGLSCVVLPEDKRKDKDGAALYDLDFADTEPHRCSGCHSPHDANDKPLLDQFQVYLLEGSTRTDKNWLDRPAAEQERVVAFGAHSILSNGLALDNMSAYNKVLSRKEVERLVAHIRTLKPVIKTIKTKDADGAAVMTH